MRIHVLGLGAVGSFVAFHLRRTLNPKHAVIALHRRDSAPALPRNGTITLTAQDLHDTQDGVEHHAYTMHDNHYFKHEMSHALKLSLQRRGDYALPLPRPKDPHGLPVLDGHIDSLIVTTKAYVIPHVMESIQQHISRDTTIVLLHNGMGVYEHLVKTHFANPDERPNFILCTNTHGLYRKDPLHVVQTGYGEIQLGIVPDPLKRNYEASLAGARHAPSTDLSLDDIVNLSDSTLPTRYLNLRNTIAALTSARALGATWRPYEEVLLSMKRKLVVNAFVNPLTALLQCKNGQLLQMDYSRWILERLCQEAEILFKEQTHWDNKRLRREWQELVEEQGEVVGPPSRLPFPRSLERGALQAEVERVIELTKDNYSSMSTDVKLGQLTEIEYINGYLRRLSQQFRKSALVNDTLYQLVKMRTFIPLVGRPQRESG